ncbi:MAG TPA: hypothetical protein VJP80_08935, partial [Candidatus Saccharimonadales bacterium]|nr:hypothetical protein [Candidatus Saccharimonadales bacterium]
SFYKGASIDEAGQMGDYITIELYGGKLDNFWVSRVAIRDQDIKRSLMVIGRSDMIQFGIAGTEPNMNELFEECASIMGRGSKLVDLVRGKFHDEVELDTVLLEVAASAHDFVPDTILLPLLQKVRAAALHAREHKQVVDWPATEDDVAPFLEALGALA